MPRDEAMLAEVRQASARVCRKAAQGAALARSPGAESRRCTRCARSEGLPRQCHPAAPGARCSGLFRRPQMSSSNTS
jgi:hypothetical protein